MWITLQEIGFPEHLIDLLRELYKDKEATVRTLIAANMIDSGLKGGPAPLAVMWAPDS